MRLLIFTDANGLATANLLHAVVRHAPTFDIDVCGIVTSHPERFQAPAIDRVRAALGRTAASVANRDLAGRRGMRARIDLARLGRRHGIRLMVPPHRDPNDAAFLESLDRSDRPEVALSLYCTTIFGRPLLECFEHAVNFHNGLLPRYKGLRATSFSLHAGEAETGFTFHRMTEAVDGGPILAQDAVPISERDTIRSATTRVVERAVAAVPGVLEQITRGEPGRPQSGPASSFNARDVRAMIRVADPSLVTAAELDRRLRAFGVVWVAIGAIWYPVTRVAPAGGRHPLAFRTADGTSLRPDRLHHLPAPLARRSRVPRE